jgi:hypothetical protein
MPLIQFDKATEAGIALFGDGRVYEFKARGYYYGGTKVRWSVHSLRREGNVATNPSRGAMIEKALRT